MILLAYKHTIGFELRAVNNMLHRQIIASENIKRVDELTGATGWLIGYLVHNRDRDIFQKDIEKEFSIRRSTASKALSIMEEKGLIKRESVPYDARLKKLVLTDRAIELNKIIETDIVEIDKKMTAGLSDEEISAFIATIQKIKKNLE